MSDMDKVKELIARGEKEQTIGLLASALLKNTNDLESWMLLGELLDDPLKKRACYKQVLRLAPDNLLALKKLQELDGSPPEPPAAANSTKPPAENKSSLDETRKKLKTVPYRAPYPPAGDSTDGKEVIIYAVVGIAAFLVLFFILANPSEPTGEVSESDRVLWVTLISLILSAVMIILIAIGGKHRD
jgi:hypothetical protein